MVTVTKVAEGHRNVSEHCPICSAHVPRNRPAWMEHFEVVHNIPREEIWWTLHTAAGMGRKDYDPEKIYDYDHMCYNCYNTYATKAELLAHVRLDVIVNEDITYLLQEDGYALLME